MNDIYLTEEEFSSRYHVSQRSAQRWRQTGEGGPKWVRLGMRRVGYPANVKRSAALAATGAPPTLWQRNC